jgi:transposase-like protein
MTKPKLLTVGLVAGSMALGALLGAIVLSPGLGFAATETEDGDGMVEVCVGALVVPPIEVAADAIGIEADDLVAALRDGQTIAEVAEANGVEPSVVVDAIVAAQRERLTAAVEEGTLTQEEADELAATLEEQATDLVNGEAELPPWDGHQGPWGHPGLWGFADGPVAAAADAIGIEAADLVAALRDGQTIAEVAEANGVETSVVVDAVAGSLQERLDSAVENGWIDQGEADELAADLAEQAAAFVNGELMPGPWHGRGPFGSPGGWGDDNTDDGEVDQEELTLT